MINGLNIKEYLLNPCLKKNDLDNNPVEDPTCILKLNNPAKFPELRGCDNYNKDNDSISTTCLDCPVIRQFETNPGQQG